MLYNYFKIAYRSLIKNPAFSFINTIGLSLGIAAFILILQYISFETSVNKFHKNLPDLYRVLNESKEGEIWDYTPPVLATITKQQFGEIENYCRVAENIGNGIVTNKEGEEIKSFKENSIAYVDGSFFEMFSFQIAEGNDPSLNESNTIALSSTTARKYFNDQNPLGKVLTINNEFGENLYTVVALFDDFPNNSDLKFDILLSLQTLANPANLNGSDWASLDGTSSYLTTYMQLQPHTEASFLEGKLNEYKKQLEPEDDVQLRLQSMATVHLATSLDDTYLHFGNLGFIYLLSAIALLILIIAWFNYINLSTAGALKRAKEVGVRKVVGASKIQLIGQFLGESLLLNFVGFILAFALVNIFQNLFNEIIGKNLSLDILMENSLWIFGLLFLVIGTISSGAYTAFALSTFSPAQTLKGTFSKSVRGVTLRKALVVFQFSISILLIASTFILFKQLRYMQNEQLGMNIEQLLVIRGPRLGYDSTYQHRKESFKNELSQATFIEKYCGSASVPTEGYNYSTSGITRFSPLPEDEKLSYSISYVDNNFFPTYEIQFSAGVNFSLEDCSKKSAINDQIILNERAAEQLGFQTSEEAIGQRVNWNEKQYEIKGVVKDYHHLSLRQSIEPSVYLPQLSNGLFTLKIKTQNIQDQITYLEGIYKEYFPGNPFEYFFVDDNYNRQYQTEQQYAQLFTSASSLAILIACLGLFGLTMFTVEQRTKEIGIRKVLGASVSQVTSLLSKDFLVLVAISILIASPISWWAMDMWLQEFAFRTEITIWIFLTAGVITVLIAILTIASQALRIAISNPVDSLRSE
jgi:putative ABC transport system permease protein